METLVDNGSSPVPSSGRDDPPRERAAEARGEPQPPAAGTLERLTAETAHDFNNLLSVILTCAGELEATLADADRERAREIALAARRGAVLTRRLIAAAGPEDVERVPVDVNRTLVETARLQVHALGDRIELRHEPAAGLPRVLLATGRLEQMLLNLLTNSRDAGARTVTVRTDLDAVGAADALLEPGCYLRLSVRDDGHGMSPQIVNRALDTHFTTKDTSQGSGLGLSTVRGIAADAGGGVRISSLPGAGTEIEVLLPAPERR